MSVEPRFKPKPKRRRSKVERDRAELGKVRPVLIERSLGRCEGRGFSALCTGVGAVIHHVQLRSAGGNNDPDNLRFLCIFCHQDVHAFPLAAAELRLIRR